MIAHNEFYSMEFTNNNEIDKILGKFSEVFATPSSLPPLRDVQHHIHLKDETQPVDVCPYHYSHFQKAEIEKLAEEML